MKSANETKAGDIVHKSFIDYEGIEVVAYPFVVLSVNKDYVSLMDERTVHAFIAMTGHTSARVEEIAYNANPSMILEPADEVKKRSVLVIDIVVLFSKDILPVDKVGELSKDSMAKVKTMIITLEKENMLKINKNNLPKVMDKMINATKVHSKVQKGTDKKVEDTAKTFTEDELAEDFFARPIKMNRPKSFDFEAYRRKKKPDSK